jgi:hypothetical protein
LKNAASRQLDAPLAVFDLDKIGHEQLCVLGRATLIDPDTSARLTPDLAGWTSKPGSGPREVVVLPIARKGRNAYIAQGSEIVLREADGCAVAGSRQRTWQDTIGQNVAV